MKTSGIYVICNTSNGKVLVGSSTNIHGRWGEHRYHARRGTHDNNYFQKSWNKHGEDSFEFRILEECDENMLLIREDAWITYYNSTDSRCGYNLQWASRVIHSAETRRKISDRLKAYRRTPEHQAHINAARVPMSAETRKKISEANLGKRMSLSARLKIAMANTGRTPTPETRKLLSERQIGPLNHRYGKKLSERHRAILATSRVRHHSEETRAKISAAKMGHIGWNKGGHVSPEMLSKIKLGAKHSWDTKPERKIANSIRMKAYWKARRESRLSNQPVLIEASA